MTPHTVGGVGSVLARWSSAGGLYMFAVTIRPVTGTISFTLSVRLMEATLPGGGLTAWYLFS